MLKKKVLNAIEEHNLIERGEHVVLGLSGGPDSVCLFHVLKELQESVGFVLSAVHVNHMMREHTNFRDENFVKELCATWNIELHNFRINCNENAKKEKISSEEAGRKARYESFSEVADTITKDGSTAKIAVAHNADDQAETLLYRIIRGTGTDGLAGMEHIRNHGEHKVIRPLLEVSRREIEEYCREHNLKYVIDETNNQPAYDRNRIRLELLPYIRENYNSNISDGLCRLADIASCDKEYLWQQAQDAYDQVRINEKGNNIIFDRKALGKFHEAISSRVILKGLRELGLWSDVSNERLKAIGRLIEGNGGTKVIQLPHGFAVTAAFDRVYLRGEGEHVKTAEGKLSITVSICERGSCDKESDTYCEGDIVLDAGKVMEETGISADMLEKSVVLRHREPRDYIPLNGGNKQIRKLMSEMRIPADARDKVPVVAVGRCVLYISYSESGKRYAETLKATSQTECKLIVKFV
ncbi:MAG: tRNA lysidine(34) synthetase TilS [Bacillota bacterium]|nr:tRNA lysidine(34) synthetase TilS [Bacillota bacterium]